MLYLETYSIPYTIVEGLHKTIPMIIKTASRTVGEIRLTFHPPTESTNV